ncbi:MAG: potassium transporter Kup [Deltaproteobacteria bacterium]|nr:potassium transporter Kup [Deltaproteobacteria bacterium]
MSHPVAASLASDSSTTHHQPKGKVVPLALAALGVVYGDIGTSPLYAVKECFSAEHGLAASSANILGILSLITWSLLLVVVLKYLMFIMRADNHGEGGILALLALLTPKGAPVTRTLSVLTVLGLFGAALLYGDGVITPAISVLSAVEGLTVAQLPFTPPVVPLTVIILVGLFVAQSRGTAKVGAVFGPATLLWFVAIAAVGLRWITKNPSVFAALDPRSAVHFMLEHRWHGFAVLGSVVLCVTGGEALYADMGHFGKQPIRLAWFSVVFPSLLLNYYGQGAYLLSTCASDPQSGACRTALRNPFFQLVPSGWMLYGMVLLATVATIVASQALISGAFSLTQQAVQLGFSPRVTIVHTSGDEAGQIYIPEINYALMVACIALVLTFGESSKLAAAYGIAVTGTMAITSVLFYAVAVRKWAWSPLKAGSLVALFLTVDLAFLAANALKIMHRGWIPLAMGAAVFVLMRTWKQGRARLAVAMASNMAPLDLFIAEIPEINPPRVNGTAVFMTQNVDGVPPVLLHHFKHNMVLHKQVILLAIRSENRPEVSPENRCEIESLGEGFFRVIAHYGFMQSPNVPEVLQALDPKVIPLDPARTSFFLGRETLIVTSAPGMSRWQKLLFALMSKNARAATAFFGLPPNRVVELGTQVEL